MDDRRQHKLLEKLPLKIAQIHLYYIHDEETACSAHSETYFRANPPLVECHCDSSLLAMMAMLSLRLVSARYT